MTFAEAIPLLIKGSHIKLPWTISGAYIALDKNNHSILSYFYKDGNVDIYEITQEDLITNYWEVIKDDIC